MNDSKLRRRDVLAAAGGTLGGFVLAGGAATADSHDDREGDDNREDGDDTERVNVGYDSQRGRRAAKNEAERVYYEFAFDALTIEVDEEGEERLRRRGDIRYVERDEEMEALEQTLPWGIDRVDADVAHDDGETGAGADVAIIDTGIQSDHPDLQATLGKGVAFLSGVKSNNWEDDNGHGTHCAGIADALDNNEGVVGVSTEATLHAVKVLSATGVGLTSDIAKGIEWTADRGYDVGNLSLGGGDSDVLHEACQYANGKGVFLAGAAGNDGPCEDCVSYPAAYQECVAVSATSLDDSLAEFSSTGPEVELAAPGENILSTYIGSSYTELSGTSMAAPHVAGGAGQLMANGYSHSEARDRLTSTAEDIGLSSNEQGAGLLDVAAALGLKS
jgi:subtilisin